MELGEGRVTANGLDFAYRETGSGPLALCLHGFPDSPHTYRQTATGVMVAATRRAAATTSLPRMPDVSAWELVQLIPGDRF
jgi:pimeloyl-ACP methyl ester carboxylesterase